MIGIRSKSKSVEQKSIGLSEFFKVIVLFCTITFILYLFTLVISILIKFPNLSDVKNPYPIMILTEESYSLLNALLLLSSVSIAIPIFEETVSRRITIPFLESKGLSSVSAVYCSSIAFIIIHIPGSLIYGNFTFVILHSITTFSIGMLLGIIYVYTKKIIFPIFFHGIYNYLGFTPHIIDLLINSNTLLVNILNFIYHFLLTTICIIGLLGIVWIIWQSL